MLNRVGAFEDAEKDLTSALALDQAHLSAKVALAAVRVGQDRASDAVGMLQGIVQAAPTNFAATYQLARALAVFGSSPRGVGRLYARHEAARRVTRCLVTA